MNDKQLIDQVCDCGHLPTKTTYSSGYGRDADGKTHCYDCCAELERQAMIETGKATLYFTHAGSFKNAVVTDWPGHLRFDVLNVSVSRHNFGGRRYDFWFWGPDDHLWHGYNIGEYTQIAHCKRTKQTRGGRK